ncbi:MAG: NTP transferase domain-containing protein [Thermoplasmata archaeon]|nr:NTP transferase domain-containing protein [Thermoplasmata archaeon]
MSPLPVPAPRPRWAAILLAGGESKRFGGRPKATAPIEGIPAIVRMAGRAADTGFDPILAVAGRHVAETREVLATLGTPVVENAIWDAGRTGSIQTGLASVGPVEGALVWPVDHPFVEAKCLATLRSVADGDPMGVWFVPTFEGRGGHPLLLRRPTFDPIASLAPDAPLRSLVPRFGPQVRRVPVDDPGILENADDRTAFDSAQARWAARQREGRWTGD